MDGASNRYQQRSQQHVIYLQWAIWPLLLLLPTPSSTLTQCLAFWWGVMCIEVFHPTRANMHFLTTVRASKGTIGGVFWFTCGSNSKIQTRVHCATVIYPPFLHHLPKVAVLWPVFGLYLNLMSLHYFYNNLRTPVWWPGHCSGFNVVNVLTAPWTPPLLKRYSRYSQYGNISYIILHFLLYDIWDILRVYTYIHMHTYTHT